MCFFLIQNFTSYLHMPLTEANVKRSMKKKIFVCMCVWLRACLSTPLLHPKHLIMCLVCSRIGMGHQIC